jgi:hypothetical protein
MELKITFFFLTTICLIKEEFCGPFTQTQRFIGYVCGTLILLFSGPLERKPKHRSVCVRVN